MGRPRHSLLYAVAIAAGPLLVSAHDHCYFGGRNPTTNPDDSTVGFCPNEDELGFCCNAEEELDVQMRYDVSDVSGDCADLHKEVLCSVCGPFSGHLYEQITDKTVDGLTMKTQFCEDYVSACGSQIDFPSDYCEVHTLNSADIYWSYPYAEEEATDFNAVGMTKAFENLDESDLPEEPMFMEMTPDGNYWWICGKYGKIVQVLADDPSEVDHEVIDISSLIAISKEEGLLGFALAPDFTGVGSYFYVSYSVFDGSLEGEDYEKVRNRLSKFTYESSASDTLSSEEILIDTEPKASDVHASGWVAFKPSARGQSNGEDDLYWSVGDGGGQYDPNNQALNPNTLLGTIVRITVPRADTSRLSMNDKFSEPAGNVQGVVCSYGHRNPFRCGFDRSNDKLYCGEVGQIKVEEINVIECGKNYGWGRFEGDLCVAGNEFDNAELGSCDDADFSSYEPPIFQYCHDSYQYDGDASPYTKGVDVCGDRSVVGQAVIGGVVYRGSKYADILEGKYLFQDFQTSTLFHLDVDGEAGAGTMVKGSEGKSVVAYVEDNAGEVYIMEYKGDIYHLPCGDLCATTCIGNGASPPYETVGCYADSESSRILSHQSETCPTGQDSMSPDICASYCSTVPGATYFGVEESNECYCGTTDKSDLTTSDGCTQQCEGNTELTCGGEMALELFFLTDAIAAPAGSTYLGCFSDTVDDRLMVKYGTDQSMTHQMCSDSCKTTANNGYYGLQYGTECWCGAPSITPDVYGTAICTVNCAGGGGICGGRYAISTYQYDDVTTGGSTELTVEVVTAAGYLGCFQDDEDNRLMTFMDRTETMTAQSCSSKCPDYKYFGVQYGNECWCSNDDSVANAGDGLCDVQCAGGEYVCGGYYTCTTYEHEEVTGTELAVGVVPGATYLGCFQDDGDNRLMTFVEDSTTMTAESCSAECARYKYFGVQYGTECWCSNDDSVVNADGGVCDMKCGGGEYVCGGYYTFTTYEHEEVTGTELAVEDVPGAAYIGCFEDDGDNRLMTFVEDSTTMTAESCSTMCPHYKFFAVQYGTECWCGGESVVNAGDGLCDMKCSGGEYVCGGYYSATAYEHEEITGETDLEAEVLAGAEHKGCFKDTKTARLMSLAGDTDTMTALECSELCPDTTYFGVQYRSECWCGDGPYDTHGEGVCDMKCSGGEYSCGGDGAMNVYESEESTTPTPYEHLGCYHDSKEARIFDSMGRHTSAYTSLEYCHAYCEALSAVYFGVQYGEECWCGTHENYALHGDEGARCDYECVGNRHETCGGYDTMNVYYV